ncbi:MAG: rRNA maturation RNase YbeY [Marinilabiliales bacterium]|nr:MAG: rRNA maturation RNase YbeY [Marinilabiliales bacterium]
MNSEEVKIWISNTISEEDFQLGILNYEFLTDNELLKMNLEYLDHDTYTDIITFNSSNSENIISGEIFVSVDRVKENSELNDQTFERELMRVIIHGVLHLCGYGDKLEEEEILMRQKENYYLTKYPGDVSRETN